MAIQIEGNQIQNGVVTFAKLASADIETTLTGSSSKLARADAIKAYIDNVAAGIHWKESVKVATTGNITLSGEQTIDGVTTSGSRVLVKNQTSGSQNGIYVSASGAWSRAADMDASAEFAGAAVFVREGSTFADTGFICTNDADPNVGTDAINFTQFTGAATLVAGDGLSKVGSTFSVNVDDSSIEIASDALQVKSLGITAGMLAGGIGNAKLSNSTISGVSLGANLNSLSVVSGSALAMTGFNGSAAVTDLGVQVDGSSIEISSNALQVKASGITSNMLAGSIAAGKINLGNGVEDNAGSLQIDLDGSSLALSASGIKVAASGVSNAMLANSTISGVSLGANLNSLSAGNGITMTSYNGSAAVSDVTIDLDGSSLAVGSNGIKVADGGIANSMLQDSSIASAKLAGSIAAGKLNLGNGVLDNAGSLQIDLDGSSLALGVNGISVASAGVSNSMLANSTISGVSLGANLNSLSAGNGLSMTSYNGSAAVSDLTIDLDGSSLAVGSDGIKVASGGIGSTQLANDSVTAAKVGFASNWAVLVPDGSLTAFDLSDTVDSAFANLIVIRNGIVLKQVSSSPSGQDEFSVSLTGGAGGVTRLTFGSAPTNGADLRVWYMA